MVSYITTVTTTSAMLLTRILRREQRWRRAFSCTATHLEVLDISQLPNRIIPRYHSMPPTAGRQKMYSCFAASRTSDLLSLQWPSPPRNILMVKKDRAPGVNESLIEYAKHGVSRTVLVHIG